jgi:hypothetical protein
VERQLTEIKMGVPNVTEENRSQSEVESGTEGGAGRLLVE